MIWDLAFYSVAIAALGKFIDFGFEEGKIFRFWWVRVVTPLGESKRWAWLASPLGGCVYCANPWLALALSPCYAHSPIDWLWVVALAHLTLRMTK